MPRIPVYQEQQQVGQQVQVSKLSVPDTGARYIAQGVQNIGAALGDMAKTMYNIQEENNKTKAMEMIANDEIEETKLFNERQSDPSFVGNAGGEGFTERVINDFDARYNAKLASLPEGSARKFYADGVRRLRSAIATGSLRFEADQGIKYTINAAKTASQGFAGFVADAPDPASAEERIGFYNAWVDSLGRLSPSQKQELKDNNKDLIYKSGLEALIRKDAEGFLTRAEKNADPFLNQLSPDQRDTYINRAKTQMHQDQAMYRQTITESVKSASLMAASGIVPDARTLGLSPEAFNKAYGREEGPKQWANFQKIQNMASTIKGYSGMTNSEISASLEAQKPDPMKSGKNYAADMEIWDAKRKAAAEIAKKRDTDPAAASAIGNPILADAEERRAAVYKKADSSFEEKSQADREFISASLAEQQRLGVKEPKPLTNAMADSLVMEINKGDQSAKQTVDMLQARYQNHYPAVMGQLVKSGKLPPEIMVIPDAKDESSKEAISRVGRFKIEQLKENVPATTATDVKQRTITMMEDVVKAFGTRNTHSQAHISAMNSTIQKLALDMIGSNPSMSTSDAVSKAYDMVLGKFEIEDGLMFPRGMSGKDIRSGLISELNDRILPSITSADVMKNLTPGATDEDNIRETRRTISARHVWITNENNTGAILYVKNVNNQLQEVKIGGKSVQVMFDDAALIGSTPTVSVAEGA